MTEARFSEERGPQAARLFLNVSEDIVESPNTMQLEKEAAKEFQMAFRPPENLPQPPVSEVLGHIGLLKEKVLHRKDGISERARYLITYPPNYATLGQARLRNSDQLPGRLVAMSTMITM